MAKQRAGRGAEAASYLFRERRDTRVSYSRGQMAVRKCNESMSNVMSSVRVVASGH